jgi:zinc transporter 1/2/3
LEILSTASLRYIYALALFAFFVVMLVEKKLIALIEDTRRKNQLNVTSSNDNELAEVDDKEQAKGHGHHHHHSGFHTHEVVDGPNVMPYVLTAGLAFHSIFEGLAIGLQTSLYGVVTLLIGIGLHKFAEAFAMGMNCIFTLKSL